MVSDEPREEGSADGPFLEEDFVGPTIRRSTYTPPARATMPGTTADSAFGPPTAPAEPAEAPAPAEALAPTETSDTADLDEVPEAPVSPGAPQPPRRRSLPEPELVEEITATVERAGSSLVAIDELERQLRLREQDAREFQAWQETVLSTGSGNALNVVEEARQQFDDIVPATAAIAIVSDAEPDVAADLPHPDDVDRSVPDVTPIAFIEPTLVGAAVDMPADMPADVPAERVDPIEEPEHEAPIDSAAEAVIAAPVTAEPVIAAPVIAEVPDAVVEEQPARHTLPPALVVEDAALRPTPEQFRLGRAVRLFWLWFAPNSSVVSVALGAVALGLGVSLRQSAAAILIGVVLSFVPLAVGTLVGRRSGQPTMVASRATFGVRGNVLPAAVALLGRLFWGGLLLWLLARSVADVLLGAGLSGVLPAEQIVFIAIGVAFVVALLVAFFGYGLLARVQFVITVIAIVLVAGLIALTWRYVDLDAALSRPDGPAILVLGGAVLVFSFVGLAWANSTADLARYQRPAGSGGGASSMLTSSLGAGIPAFVLVGYGALLAASDPEISAGLEQNPLDTLGRMLPLWYPAPLIAAAALSLLAGVIVSIYSGSFALAALGIRAKQTVSTLVVAILVLAAACGFALIGADLDLVFRDLATTLAVPVAAWTGIVVTETLLRKRSFDSRSLLATGGIYPSVRWGVLSAYVVIIALGFGLTTAEVAGLDWQGYLFPLLGVVSTDAITTTDVGVLVALVLGLLAPLAVSLRAIRRQEAAEPGR